MGTCGVAKKEAQDTYTCQVSGNNAADDKCKNQPTATKTECAATAACGTWTQTAGTCINNKCGLAATQLNKVVTCVVGGKNVADDKCKNKPTPEKTDCVKTADCEWKETAATCPTNCGATQTTVNNVVTCVDLD